MKLLKILEKESSERSARENEEVKIVLSQFPLFSDRSERSKFLLEECCKLIQYKVFLPGDIISDARDFYYFIVKGSVCSSETEIEEQVFPHSQIEIIGNFQCLDRTVLLCIEKQVVSKLKRSFNEIYYHEFIGFMKTVPVLERWTKGSLSKLCSHMTVKHFKKHQFVYKQNDFVDSFYIIKSGEVLLTKDSEFNDSFSKYTRNKSSEYIGRVKTKLNKKFAIKIVAKEAKELLGYEEILQNTDRRMRNCKCNSLTVELLEFTAKSFYKIIKYPDIRSMLNKHNQLSALWTNERMTRLRKMNEIENTTGKKTTRKLNLLRIEEERAKFRFHIVKESPKRELPYIIKNCLKNETPSPKRTPKRLISGEVSQKIFDTELKKHSKSIEIRLDNYFSPRRLKSITRNRELSKYSLFN